jgi:hypothetical protein
MRKPEPHQLTRAAEAARRAVGLVNASELLRGYDYPTGGCAGSTFLDLESDDSPDLTATELVPTLPAGNTGHSARWPSARYVTDRLAQAAERVRQLAFASSLQPLIGGSVEGT